MTQDSASTAPARNPQSKRKIYLESRYRKLERGLPQTIFYCPDCKGDRRRRKDCQTCEGFGKLTKDSVQELLARHILPAFKAKFGKFHGAGREDIDVLMLGQGRPFVYEVVGARNFAVDLPALREQIQSAYAGRIEIAPMQVVAKKMVAFWKESHFEKAYRCRVRAESGWDAKAAEDLVGTTLDLRQRTPQRVAHRRADLERERQLTVLKIDRLDDEQLQVEIRCAHGTYVKEWVSGDDGRTTPSLAETLGAACECAQLDVLEIYTESGNSTDGTSTAGTSQPGS